MRFLLLYFFDAHAWATMSPEDKDGALQRIQAWRQEPAYAQRVVHTGELRGTDETISVFLGPAGHSESPQVIPGPYLQAAESLGGYLVVEAADQDEVIALVKTWPTGGVFEIRSIL
jgi:hypothetical protein